MDSNIITRGMYLILVSREGIWRVFSPCHNLVNREMERGKDDSVQLFVGNPCLHRWTDHVAIVTVTGLPLRSVITRGDVKDGIGYEPAMQF